MTFADLGIPFPLWEAPIECAPDYAGLQTCSLCHIENQHCFRLNGGDAVMVLCSVCQSENGLSKNDKEDGAPCIRCGAALNFPPTATETRADETMQICYNCLRAGHVAITKDTVFGLIAWEDALKGQTYGVPRLDPADAETVTTVEIADGWTAARLAPEAMSELLRTPGYSSWQGERWQFDEGQPMIFVGEWNRTDFNKNAPNGDGKALFGEIVPDTYEGQWDNLSNDQSCVYVFRSATRQKWAAHWDMD